EDPRTYIQALEPLIQGTARRRVPGRQQKRRAVEGFGEITAIGLSQLGAAEKRHTALTEQMIKGFYIKRWGYRRIRQHHIDLMQRQRRQQFLVSSLAADDSVGLRKLESRFYQLIGDEFRQDICNPN